MNSMPGKIGLVAVASLGVSYLYKYSKMYYDTAYKKTPKPVSNRELMQVGGVTSIIGLALSFCDKPNLYRIVNSEDYKNSKLNDN